MQHHKYVVNHCQASFSREDIEICLAEGSLTEDQLRVLVDEQNGWHGKPSYDEIMQDSTDFNFIGERISGVFCPDCGLAVSECACYGCRHNEWCDVLVNGVYWRSFPESSYPSWERMEEMFYAEREESGSPFILIEKIRIYGYITERNGRVCYDLLNAWY